jgi:hypothetical protein
MRCLEVHTGVGDVSYGVGGWSSKRSSALMVVVLQKLLKFYSTEILSVHLVDRSYDDEVYKMRGESREWSKDNTVCRRMVV